MLENTPVRFSTILSDNIAATNNFMTYLNAHTDLIGAMVNSEDGKNILQTYTTFHPKKLHHEYLVPTIVKEDFLRNGLENPCIVKDYVSQDMVINPAKITNEDTSIYEYREIYWWLLASRTHPTIRETVLELGQDPDDILVLDEAKMQAIKELLKTWLDDNLSEKFLHIIKQQDGVDFLLSLSDIVQNLDSSTLQQSIVYDENTSTVEAYLQRSENGRKLCDVIISHQEQSLSISSLPFVEDDNNVEPNPSRLNYPTSHRVLSSALSTLVDSLFQYDRDNRKWLSIRPVIIDGLNTVIYEEGCLLYTSPSPRD